MRNQNNFIQSGLSHKVAIEEDCADRRKGRDIEGRLQISPQKSLRHLAQETGVSLGSPFTATKLIKFRLYKITVVPELKQPDYAAKIRFCNWLLQNVHNGIFINDS
jgi:hypothetical protein